MNLRSFLGASAILCASSSLSCSDDSDGPGVAGFGGTAGGGGSGGTGGAGTGGTAGGGGTGGAGTGGTAGGGGSAMGGSSSGAGGFAQDVHPILIDMCGECHGGTGDASFAFAQTDPAGAYQAAISNALDGVTPVYQLIITRTENGGMPLLSCFQGDPPGTPGCLTVMEFQTLQQWAQSGTPPPP
jgi:hypothetical protein